MAVWDGGQNRPREPVERFAVRVSELQLRPVEHPVLGHRRICDLVQTSGRRHLTGTD